MSSSRTEYDVYLSYTQRDRALADQVAARLTEAGVSAFKWQDALTAGASINALLLNALAESAAMVVVAEGDLVSPNVLAEIGAAMAWQKPIYLVYAGDVAPRVGFSSHSITVVPARDLEEVIRSVHQASQPLTEQQFGLLRKAYIKVGTPTDVLLTSPVAIDRLTREFNRLGRTNLSGPKLLRELLRLRKQKKLPPLKRKSKKRGS